MNLLLNLLGLRVHLSDHLVDSRDRLGKIAIMALHLFATVLFSNKEKLIEDLESNLVHQIGNSVLESLGDVDQATNVMTNVGIDDTLGTDSSLVSLAVGVDLILRMLLAVKNPG